MKKKTSKRLQIIILFILIIAFLIFFILYFKKNDTEVKQQEDENVVKVELFCSFNFTKCKDVFSLVYQLKKEYQNNDKVKFYYYDIDSTGLAYNAFLASLAAGKQNKEWEYIQLLFDNQNKFEDSDLIGYANNLSLNESKFNDDRNSSNIASDAKYEFDYGNSRRITSCPTLAIMDTIIQEKFDEETIKNFIEDQLQLLLNNSDGQNT